ncbi:MAG: hypothetical protein ABSC94_11110 [Polyangiaceae bacterium]|jgi:hypothetical protein
MASVILGDWTHRRGDRGGARAVEAEIDKPRPTIAWTWQPEHRGRVDQVRIAGGCVLVATMAPRDSDAPGWEHAVLYALDAESGLELARRVLPDPVPVAAMVVEAGLVNVVATRKGEPIYWYSLSTPELVASHRRIIVAGSPVRPDDVLDAWATPDGGLWLELDVAVGPEGLRARTYSFANAGGDPIVVRVDEHAATEGPPIVQDACACGQSLYVPVDGRWGGAAEATPSALSRLDASSVDEIGGVWACASVVGPRARIHALCREDVIYGATAAEDPAKPDRLRIEAFAVDRASGNVHWRAQDERVALTDGLGDTARTARRPNGELLFQRLGPDGVPCTPLICARPDGRLDTVLIGARGPYVLDAALGPIVLAHRENKDGRVEVGGFAIDREGRLLGRRAIVGFAIDAGDLGQGVTVYAGAGVIVARGSRSVCAIRL